MFPKMNIFEISKHLLGRWGGTVVNLFILFHFWQIVVRDISSVSRFNSTLLLHNTPLEILILLPCLLLIYFGKSSVEVIARVNDLFYPLFVITTSVDAAACFRTNSIFDSLCLFSRCRSNIGLSNLLAIGSAGIFSFSAPFFI